MSLDFALPPSMVRRYHPMLARVAEVQGIVGAELRPGDRGFGEQDVPTIVRWLKDLRTAVGPHCELRVRVDAARSTESDNGKQLYLWDGMEYTAQCYLTNDWCAPE